MSTSALARRLDAFGTPMPAALKEMKDALQTLHEAGVRLAGDDRARLFHRCATGQHTAEDLALLARLPVDALKAAGAIDAMDYATFMSTVLNDDF